MTDDRSTHEDEDQNGAEPAPTDEQLELEFLTVPEVAKHLRCAPGSVYDRVHEGVIPHIRLGHRIIVPRYALAQAIERMMNDPEEPTS